uniref:Activin_recp domain-containing protein n=1 Tax=Rhabditophanes sp. KR3021 TaxID=114890 RepID=A0AC35TQT6_9BILA
MFKLFGVLVFVSVFRYGEPDRIRCVHDCVVQEPTVYDGTEYGRMCPTTRSNDFLFCSSNGVDGCYAEIRNETNLVTNTNYVSIIRSCATNGEADTFTGQNKCSNTEEVDERLNTKTKRFVCFCNSNGLCNVQGGI